MSDTTSYTLQITPTDGEWGTFTQEVGDQTVQVKHTPRATVVLPDGTTHTYSVAISLGTTMENNEPQ